MSTEYGTCEPCRRSAPLVARARAVGPYDGVLRGIVHALKYEGRRSLARPLGAMMREHGAGVLAGSDALVPVPLHPSRRRTRGFNQADDLARAVGAPVVRALRRVRATADQVQLPILERQTNVRDAFAITSAGTRLDGAIVVLVDDVSTTGATLDACARALREAGVREVRGLTAARA
jgi:ComF family protein